MKCSNQQICLTQRLGRYAFFFPCEYKLCNAFLVHGCYLGLNDHVRVLWWSFFFSPSCLFKSEPVIDKVYIEKKVTARSSTPGAKFEFDASCLLTYKLWYLRTSCDFCLQCKGLFVGSLSPLNIFCCGTNGEYHML